MSGECMLLGFCLVTTTIWSESESEVAQLCPTLCDPTDCCPPDSSIPGIFQARYWSGLPFPSPGDLLDPGIEPGLPSCRQTLYHLSHQGSQDLE